MPPQMYSSLFVILGLLGAAATADSGSLLQAGDQAISRGEFTAAVGHYTTFIKSDPKAALGYTKRAAAYLQQRKNKEALSDLDLAVEVDPTFLQGYLHRGRLLRQACQFTSAARDFQQVLEMKPGHSGAEKEMGVTRKAEESLRYAREWIGRGEVANAEGHLDQLLLLHAPDCKEARLMKAHLQVGRGDYAGAVVEAGKVLKEEETNLEGLLLRGRSYYYMADHEVARRHFQAGLRSDPEHAELKKEYRKLKTLEKKTKAVDPSHSLHNVKLHLGLCSTCVKLGRANDAITACNDALEIDSGLTEALVQRAEAKMILEEFEGAVADFRAALEKEQQDRSIMASLQQAEQALKLSKRKDWYKILGLDRGAGQTEIKRAYKKLALQWHPDKNVGNQEEAEVKFRLIAEAYEVLGDEEKKGKYDRGEDLDEPQGHPGHGGGFHHPFGGGGGNFHYQYGGGGGFGGGPFG